MYVVMDNALARIRVRAYTDSNMPTYTHTYAYNRNIIVSICACNGDVSHARVVPVAALSEFIDLELLSSTSF